MMRTPLEKYRIGMITDDHLVVESLQMVDPENPALTLSSLPDNILKSMLQFAKDYRHGHMLTNYGVLPAEEQVLAASRWIEMLFQQKATKKV